MKILDLKQGETLISEVFEGQWFRLPTGDMVSPAMAGWSNGTYRLVAQPTPTAEELLEFERSGMQLTFTQLLIGLVSEEWITEAEGEAWLARTLPTPVLDLIATLPSNQRFAAKARALQPTMVLRNDDLVVALGAAQGKSPLEIDEFFRVYALV